MTESYEEKFNELKKSISNFTEIDAEIPLGDKIKQKLGETYDEFLKEEIVSVSQDFRNIPMKKLLKNNFDGIEDKESFKQFYDNYFEKTKKEIDFNFDQFEELLTTYSEKLLSSSDRINELEIEIMNYFKEIDEYREWIESIPSNLDVDKNSIFEQIQDIIENKNIKDKISEYKKLKVKYFFLKHYFFVNPFILIAEDDNVNCNDNEPMYKNDLESEIRNELHSEQSPPPSLIKSFFNLFM
jgi:hypothetical protein